MSRRNNSSRLIRPQSKHVWAKGETAYCAHLVTSGSSKADTCDSGYWPSKEEAIAVCAWLATQTRSRVAKNGVSCREYWCSDPEHGYFTTAIFGSWAGKFSFSDAALALERVCQRIFEQAGAAS